MFSALVKCRFANLRTQLRVAETFFDFRQMVCQLRAKERTIFGIQQQNEGNLDAQLEVKNRFTQISRSREWYLQGNQGIAKLHNIKYFIEYILRFSKESWG